MSDPTTQGPSAPAASEPPAPEPQTAPVTPPAEPPRAAPIPVKSPNVWARLAQPRPIDPALVAGAAVLAGWPAGNLKDGTLLVSLADFDAAMKAFAALEIR